MALLLLLILLIPVVEVYVFVQVSHQLGFLTTLGVLVLVSILGAWLVKYEGIAVWQRLQQQLGAGNVPTNEIIDGFLVLLAGALLLTPGFVTDALGIVLLLPPVRAGVRSLARRRYTKQVRIIRATHTGPIHDVSGEETGAGEAQPLTDAPPVPLRDAATLMLVRDGETGLEVFMMRRTLSVAFVAGFYVFPGGAVDTADRDESLAVHVVGRNDHDASRALGIERGGLASWVAALRECFEEAGVLLAVHADGSPIGFDDPDVARRYLGHRAALHRGELSLADLCSREGIRLAADRLYYVSHWITPVGEPRRFDTRFFLAATPLNQEPLHDDNETIASLWVNPAEALAMQQRGDLQLIAPTIRNLQFLVPHTTAADVLAAGAAVVDPPPMFPRLLRDGNGFHLLLPGDTGYEDAS